MSKKTYWEEESIAVLPLHSAWRPSPAAHGGGSAFMAGIIVALFVWLRGSGKSPQAYTLAPESALPAAVWRASQHVQEAYRFAIDNRETLRWIPCFCGCGHKGHTSNAACYIKDVKPDGSIVFDFMSLN